MLVSETAPHSRTIYLSSFSSPECPASKIPQELAEQFDFIVAAIPMVSELSTTVEASVDVLQAVCGFDSPQALVNVANTAGTQLCDVAEVLKSIRLYFQCENWYPLYETTVYEAMCYSGTEGFAWVASTQFVIVFMAMVVLTFRVVFYDARENANTAQVDDATKDATADQKMKVDPVVESPGKSIASLEPTLTASSEDDGSITRLVPTLTATRSEYDGSITKLEPTLTASSDEDDEGFEMTHHG
jgi:hypothetical protein